MNDNENNHPSEANMQEGTLPEAGISPELPPEGVSPDLAAAIPAAAPAVGGRDGRKFLRANVSWRAAIRINNQAQAIKVVNVSEGGLGIVTEIALPMGQSFQMAVMVPLSVDLLRQEQVVFTGKVVHSVISGGMYRIGMQFVTISDSHRSLIRDWVSAHGKSI
ncbi:MAG: PilZ domain-containing protein [Burkholderiales bacterium]